MIKTFLCLLLALLFGCTSGEQKAEKFISEQIDLKLTQELRAYSTSAYFLYYAVPSNYWYPDGTGFHEIFNDKWERGINGLSRLEEIVNQIYPYDSETEVAIANLNVKIDSTKKKYMEGKRALESQGDLFGLLFSGFVDFSMLNMSAEEKRNADEEACKFPHDVSICFEELLDLLKYQSFISLPSKLNDFEQQSISDKKLNSSARYKLRSFYKQQIRNKINQFYNSTDTICRSEMITRLFDSYDQDYLIPQE